MNKHFIMVLCLLICRICNSQNLVPNGSFENISSCPTGQNQLYKAVPWQMPPNTGGASSDLFNACNTTGFGVPANVDGYQHARTGVGYAGFYTYGGGSNREYIQVQLSSALTAGVVYQVEMYVNPSEYPGVAIDAIGIHISTGPVSGSGTPSPLPFVPQISNPTNNILSDTSGWALVSGLYTAAGGENYITIGNFLNDSSTYFIIFNPSGWDRGYYRVDDVFVSVATSVYEINNQEAINIYPNPLNYEININAKNGNELLEVSFYDVSGRRISATSFMNSILINTEKLAKGMYLYEVRSKSGLCKKGKIVKN